MGHGFLRFMPMSPHSFLTLPLLLQSQGGGLYLSSGTCLLVDVSFSSNAASSIGNDVYVVTGSTLLIAEFSMDGPTVMEYNDIFKVDASATIFKGCSAGYSGLLKVQSPNGASCDSESSGSITTTGGYPYPDPNNCGQSKNQPCNFCSPCSDGMISLGAQTTCTLCPPGTYSNSDHSACLPCQIGSASIGGLASCSICSDGQYSDFDGAAVCKTAPAGKKPTTSRTAIESCEAGKYSVGGASECTSCETGKFSVQGAVGCTPASTCGAGTRIMTASTAISDADCEDCPAGKYSIGGTAECTACETGKYSTATKAVGCTPASTCGAGTR